MKRLITLLFVGSFFVSTISSQVTSPAPVNIVGNVKVAASGVLNSKGPVYSGISTGGDNGSIVNEGTINLPKGIVFVSDGNTDGTLLNKGTVNFGTAEQSDVKVIKKFGAARYSSISFPFDVRVGDITDVAGTKVFDTDFYIMYYDAQRRANYGMNEVGQSDDNWQWIEAANPDVVAEYSDFNDYILKADKAYLIYTPTAMDLVFSATAGIDKMYATQDKSINAVHYTHTWPDSQTTDLSFGWNYIGNLQTTEFKINVDDPEVVVTGTLQGYQGAIYYLDGLIWDTFDPNMEDIRMAPFVGCFVQVKTDTTLIFKEDGRGYFDGISKEIRAEERRNPYKDFLELDLDKDGEFKDQLRVIFGENYNKGFVIEEDAVKMFSMKAEEPDFYTLTGNNPLIYNKLPYSETEVPVGLRTGESGMYTIRINDLKGYDDKNILLKDKELNVIQDLREDSYTFNAGVINTKDRFVLLFVDGFTNIENPESENVIVYTDNNIVHILNIAEGDQIQIFNTSGSLISTEMAYASEISIPVNQGTGVYIVKITGTNSLITKVIIK